MEIAWRLWDEEPYHNPNTTSLCRLPSRQERTSQRRQRGPQPTPRCSIDLRFARSPTGTDLASARRRPQGADDWPSRGREVAFSTRLIGQSGVVHETRWPPDRTEDRADRRSPVRSPLSILYCIQEAGRLRKQPALFHLGEGTVDDVAGLWRCFRAWAEIPRG